MSNEQADELAILAAKANDCHWKYRTKAVALLPLVKVAGEALIAAKALVKHGEWLDWLRSNFDASFDTAEVYMKVARHWNKLQQALQANPKLSIDEALKRLKDRPAPGQPAPAPVPVPRPRAYYEPTPADLARTELRDWLKATLRAFTDAEVLYLVKQGRDLWNYLWDTLGLELQPLARLVVPAQAQRQQLLAKLEQEPCKRDDDGLPVRSASWHKRRARVEAQAKATLLKGLAGLPRLTQWQRDEALELLGVDTEDFDGTLSGQDMGQMVAGARLRPAQCHLLTSRLVALIDHCPQAPAGFDARYDLCPWDFIDEVPVAAGA